MVQRVQSIYLFLAGVIILLGVCFIPFLSMTVEGVSNTCTYGVMGFRIVGGLAALLIFVTIFFYKQRKRQIALCTIVSVLLLSLTLSQIGLYFFHHIGGESLWEGAPLLSLLLTWMARGRIQKDEALVRAADRLR